MVEEDGACLSAHAPLDDEQSARALDGLCGKQPRVRAARARRERLVGTLLGLFLGREAASQPHAVHRGKAEHGGERYSPQEEQAMVERPVAQLRRVVGVARAIVEPPGEALVLLDRRELAAAAAADRVEVRRRAPMKT